MLNRKVLWIVLACSLLLSTLCQAATRWVATTGSDTAGDGTSANPYASITTAVDNAADGDLILVRPGTYAGRQRLRQQFSKMVTIRSEVPYLAQLRNSTPSANSSGATLIVYEGQNITIEGFDISHAPDNLGGLVIQVQDLLGLVNGSDDGSDPVVSRIVFRNNIIHDSTNNDLLKINNGAEDVLVEGNLFFNQAGPDEHIDINSVIGVTVQDNIFFNTRDLDTSSFVVVKDSGENDTVVGARDVIIRRNVFLNWQGSAGQSFVRLGEDSKPYFEARDVLVENNLMLGNSGDRMRAPFTVQGSSNVLFRSNTIVGDMPALSFGARLIALGPNPPNQNIQLSGNIYSDPTGTMGSEQFSGVDLFDAPSGQTTASELAQNLYFNGGAEIPADTGQVLRFADDANSVVGDPLLASTQGLVLPSWDGASFADGSMSIREAFERLVAQYGTPAVGSPALDVANLLNVADEDILGQERGRLPDIGALEREPVVETIYSDGFEGLFGMRW